MRSMRPFPPLFVSYRVHVPDGVGDGGLGGADDEVDEDLEEAVEGGICLCSLCSLCMGEVCVCVYIYGGFLDLGIDVYTHRTGRSSVAPKKHKKDAPADGPVDDGGGDGGVEVHLRCDRHVHNLVLLSVFFGRGGSIGGCARGILI